MQNINCYSPYKQSSLQEVHNDFFKCKGAPRLKNLRIAQTFWILVSSIPGSLACWINKSEAADHIIPCCETFGDPLLSAELISAYPGVAS